VLLLLLLLRCTNCCSLIERGKLERGEKVLQRIRGTKGKVANPFAIESHYSVGCHRCA
jgi:hypothetical protein